MAVLVVELVEVRLAELVALELAGKVTLVETL